MKVIKRDGRKVEYNRDKIVIAISNANKEVGGKDKISRADIEFITKYIEKLGTVKIYGKVDIKNFSGPISKPIFLTYNGKEIIVLRIKGNILP